MELLKENRLFFGSVLELVKRKYCALMSLRGKRNLSEWSWKRFWYQVYYKCPFDGKGLFFCCWFIGTRTVRACLALPPTNFLLMSSFINLISEQKYTSNLKGSWIVIVCFNHLVISVSRALKLQGNGDASNFFKLVPFQGKKYFLRVHTALM